MLAKILNEQSVATAFDAAAVAAGIFVAPLRAAAHCAQAELDERNVRG